LRINKHHIKYQDKDGKDWVVEIPAFLHKDLFIIQRWKPTQERMTLMDNYIHAITHLWNEMREKMDDFE